VNRSPHHTEPHRELTSPRGAYGLTLTSHEEFPATGGGLITAPAKWPQWHVRWQVADPDAPAVDDLLDDSHAVAVLAGGGVARIDRASATTELTLPHPPTPQSLVHPHLAITALVAGGWLGRRTFHAGSFVHGGGVWAVLGDREQGKSSTLAWLVNAGMPVFADDLLVVEGDTALAGPRVLDLRAGAARHFGMGRDLGVVGTRERWRVDLEEVPAELPLRGWIVLRWGAHDEPVHVEAVPLAERLEHLVAARGVVIAEPSTAQWLPIIAKPMVRLRRPRDWNQLDTAMHALLGALDAA